MTIPLDNVVGISNLRCLLNSTRASCTNSVNTSIAICHQQPVCGGVGLAETPRLRDSNRADGGTRCPRPLPSASVLTICQQSRRLGPLVTSNSGFRFIVRTPARIAKFPMPSCWQEYTVLVPSWGFCGYTPTIWKLHGSVGGEPRKWWNPLSDTVQTCILFLCLVPLVIIVIPRHQFLRGIMFNLCSSLLPNGPWTDPETA